ncbi:MAG: threonine ammonia-lyase [Streptosporangiales bacterium]
MPELVSIDDVRAAAKRLSGIAVRTPLVPWPRPDDRDIAIKPESLQPTGAFKLRGAYNAIASLTDEERAAGVVTHSSGNHGRAVAWAARAFGVRACVVVPDSAPTVKVDGIRAFGGEVVPVPVAERLARVEAIAAESGATVVPPYEHPAVIAGQGTVGLEIAEDAPDVAAVLVPVSGGGLISGIALAIAATCPEAKVIGVEPELAADAAESLAAGERVAWDEERTGRTAADGLRVPVVGELTWQHIRAYVHDVLTVTEDEITATVRDLALGARLVAEPSGAVAPAAAIYRSVELPAGKIVAVLSGGNASPDALAQAIDGDRR